MLQRDLIRTALYRFFNAEGTLLYVGITQDIEQRWASHARLQPWWMDVARKAVEWHDTRPAAKTLEDEALQREKPLYDRSGRLRGEVEQGKLVDARLVLETARAAAAIGQAIDNGTFPAWRLMPTIGGLAQRFRLPLVAVSKAVEALERREGRIVRFGDRFAPGDPNQVPKGAARQHGGVYVLARQLFGVELFSVPQLAAATGYGRATVDHHLRKLVKAKVVDRQPANRGSEGLFRLV